MSDHQNLNLCKQYNFIFNKIASHHQILVRSLYLLGSGDVMDGFDNMTFMHDWIFTVVY